MHRTSLLIMVASLWVMAGCQQEQSDRSRSAQGSMEADTLVAVEDFERIELDGYVPSYRDPQTEALAVNSIEYPDRFGAAETEWDGPSGTYNVSIVTVPEEDGESTYRLFVNGTQIGEFVNPETDEPFDRAAHTWADVDLRNGDAIRVASNTHSNELIPEDDGYAWARGRWTHLIFEHVP